MFYLVVFNFTTIIIFLSNFCFSKANKVKKNIEIFCSDFISCRIFVMSYDFDVAIIGGGPGGIKAAKVLAGGGKKVVLIEQHLIGGECLHYGCIPSKVFLYTSELFEKLSRISTFGIDGLEPEKVRINFSSLLERKKRIVDMLHRGLCATFEKIGVEILNGKASVVDGNSVDVTLNDGAGGSRRLNVEYIIVATGSDPITIQNISGETNRTIFDLKELPASLVIVGGGAIGSEFASFFTAVGSKVTLIERGERLLAHEDEEISAEFLKILQRKGATVLLNTSYESGKFSADCVLFALGRRVLKVDYPESVFVIGDAAQKHLLAYTAEREGEIAARKILGRLILNDESRDVSHDFVFPSTLFTHPEIASVGRSSRDVPEGIIGKAAYTSNSKALIEGDRDGFAKVVVDRASHVLFGVHIIGKHATLVIDKAALAVSEELTVEKFLRSLHGHPVVSEVLKEACEQAIEQF